MMNYIYTLIPIALIGFAAVQGSKWNFNAATYMDKKYTNAVKGIPLLQSGKSHCYRVIPAMENLP